MSWNPFKKKDADEPDAAAATAPLPPATAASGDDDDDTKPIMDAGSVTEHVNLIRESNGVRLEQVKVTGPNGSGTGFTRLIVTEAGAVADGIAGLVDTQPEALTGFRDLLVRPDCALAAAFDPPQTNLQALLDELLADGDDGPSLRAQDLLAIMASLAKFCAAAQAEYGLIWAEPKLAGIGLRRTNTHLPEGLWGWQPVFTAWDALKPGSPDPAQLIHLLLPVIESLEHNCQTLDFLHGKVMLRPLIVRLLLLTDRPELTYAGLADALATSKPSFMTFGLTDNGVKRDHNEDAWLSFQIDQASSTGAQFMLAVVADGMGGHASGEVASSLALDLLRQQLMMSLLTPRSQPVPTVRLIEQLKSVIPSIDRALTERAQLDEAMAGMGTTMAGVAVLRQATTLTEDGGRRLGEETAAVFHVGDSRVYRYGPDGLKRLTRDHSLVQDLLNSGTITADEAFSHPRKNVIMRCLGGGDSDGTPDVNLFTPGEGEVLLIASDGLSDALRDSEIAAAFRNPAYQGLEEIATALVAAANAAGGPDNITVLLVSCAETHSPLVIVNTANYIR